MPDSGNSKATKLQIKVVPGASMDEICGWLGDDLKVRVCVPPEKGKANAAVIKLLARSLDIPVNAISVYSGHTAKRKIIRISGISNAELHANLARILK